MVGALFVHCVNVNSDAAVAAMIVNFPMVFIIYIILYCFFLISSIVMWFSLRASLSCDCAHLIPLFRNALFPLTWVLGNLPFFFMMIVMARSAMLTAIINNVSSRVFNISIIFVKQRMVFVVFHRCYAVLQCKDSAFLSAF